MSTAGIIKVSVACPVLDGTEYPYWKNKMRMHLEAIDVDLWYVVKNGVPKAGEGVTAADVKRCWGSLQKLKKFYASPRSIYGVI